MTHPSRDLVCAKQTCRRRDPAGAKYLGEMPEQPGGVLQGSLSVDFAIRIGELAD
ncbi:hypothetical protein [Erwinia persicina]|uniref:Uncharacterized protein n=1 Tax=Erwinia persicina TaxID=55211 RepID=A0ABR8ZY51_9GAMM|nr:hypothetical protein [Erwinia persicina]MBD8108368.1 hypothetical protein [Erwinia persicina]MBD8211407.1 hypothetical protein [Erwinia persicina]